MNDKKKRDPSSLYYGWWIVLALSITETFSYGTIYYAFQVFIQPMRVELGWSLSGVTGAFSLALLISAFVTLPVGVWLDKYGGRAMMTGASVLATLMLLAWASVDALPQFYGIWAILGVAMAMLFYDPAFVIITNWFIRRRSFALAIVTFTGGFASTIFLPLADFLLNQYGWRGAVTILAIAYGVVTIPLHGFILRHLPENLGLLPDGDSSSENTSPTTINNGSNSTLDAIRSRKFILLSIGFGLIILATRSIRVHFIPYAISVGIVATTAAWLAGLIGATQVVGRLIFAPLEAKFAPRTMTIIIFVVIVIAFMLLLLPITMSVLGSFVLIFGAGFGALTLARPVILADSYGTSHFGRINSVMAFIMIIVTTIAPIGTSLVVEHFGDYQVAIIVLASISAFAIIPIIGLSEQT